MKYQLKSEIIIEEFEQIQKYLKENGYQNNFKRVLNERNTKSDIGLSNKEIQQMNQEFIQKYKKDNEK